MQIVREIEAAHCQKNPEKLAQLFTENGIFVNAVGIRLHGRLAIYESAERVMRGLLANSYARYEVESIHFLRPDVAVVNVIQHPVTREGKEIREGIKGSPMYVVIKEAGKWMIAAGQNTLLQNTITNH